MKVDSFIKDELYPAYKHSRAINSRTDAMKCALGPIFKLIEKEVFSLDWFIKKIPVSERPNYIMDRVYIENGMFVTTDYTAFESLFTPDLMKSCELIMYKYMTKNLQGHHFTEIIEDLLTGENVCRFKWFTVSILGKRMSGEMCTSLGNGFSNLMAMLFLCEELGSEVVGVVEGDDGLFCVKGECPTARMFQELGLLIKMDVHNTISTASFCGLIFDPLDRINVTDPIDALLSFGWTSKRYAKSKSKKLKGLLRAKALSLAYSYPGCPILQSLSDYGLRVTHGVRIDLNALDSWKREQFMLELGKVRVRKTVPLRTRLLMQDLYNIPIHVQRGIEMYLDGLQDLHALDCAWINMCVPDKYKDYYANYVHKVPYEEYRYPNPARFPKMKDYDAQRKSILAHSQVVVLGPEDDDYCKVKFG